MDFRVVAIDPGLSSGIAVFIDTHLVGYSEINTESYEDIVKVRRILECFAPFDLLVVEATSWRASAYTKCAKYQAGVLIGALGLQRTPVKFVAPTTWRKAVLGSATAGKEQARTLAQVHSESPIESLDVAEAICLGLFAVKGEHK